MLSIGVNLLSQCRVHDGGGVHCLCCSSLIVSSTWRFARSAVAKDAERCVHSPPDSASRSRVKAACCIGDILNLVASDTALGHLRMSCGIETFVPVFLCLWDGSPSDGGYTVLVSSSDSPSLSDSKLDIAVISSSSFPQQDCLAAVAA
ncbi:hypothetical protein DPEC_G00002220 [Dallia pectoralis]|uniref:Uncharacterized protein n=1 Tax=Dallia pectoralis TaxID=75939 RepID=A0ACC2HIY4_DALPE|nr:hypothetical protein DPEC_G00002220 [Dallia pectoralis]